MHAQSFVGHLAVFQRFCLGLVVGGQVSGWRAGLTSMYRYGESLIMTTSEVETPRDRTSLPSRDQLNEKI